MLRKSYGKYRFTRRRCLHDASKTVNTGGYYVQRIAPDRIKPTDSRRLHPAANDEQRVSHVISQILLGRAGRGVFGEIKTD